MKVIIDLIEDIREEIGHESDFSVHAMLLKEDGSETGKLVNAGESEIHGFDMDQIHKKLILKIDGSQNVLDLEGLVKHLLILDMDAMMYEVKLNVNHKYSEVEVIGFGKSMEEKKYFIFIKL